MGSRRKHSKITSILPQGLVEAINERLVAGETYESIAAYVRLQGHEISKSAVGRYGKDFLSKLERLRVVKEQARAIVSEGKDGPALEMTEAATQLALQLIMERLKALALLERSAVQREKLKIDAGKLLDLAVDRIKQNLQKELEKNPDVMEKLIGMVDAIASEAKEKR